MVFNMIELLQLGASKRRVDVDDVDQLVIDEFLDPEPEHVPANRRVLNCGYYGSSGDSQADSAGG
ncbi:hypothetical protein [Sphingomonas sp.]|uniref:hypothetical protein n=1 Tax=Sphingomonas sp. TaxID=28214 RepID=UPI0025EFA7F7|nr:hypothetical protein [Sphingomonas sp.]